MIECITTNKQKVQWKNRKKQTGYSVALLTSAQDNNYLLVVLYYIYYNSQERRTRAFGDLLKIFRRLSVDFLRTYRGTYSDLSV